MKKEFKNPFIIFYLLILSIIFAITVFLYYRSAEIFANESKEITKIEISHVNNFAKNISKRVLEIAGNNMVQNIKKSPNLQKHINALLSMFSTDQYKYVYLIYINKDKKFRYLADGSKDISQRGELNQPFIPIANIWDQITKTAKPKYTIQNKTTGLWLTYLYPIKHKDALKAVLAFDISLDEYHALVSVIKPLKNILFYASLFQLIILVFSFFQAYIYFKQRRRTNIDPLTHLYNRNYLNSIEKNIDLRDCAIAMADIDHFKKINDTYGHDAGDIVLESISKRLLSSTRTFDDVIRYGGEEFLIILRKQSSIKNTKEICNRILKSISSHPIRINRSSLNVTVSIGVNPTPYKDETLAKAIKKADEMLYVAKRAGRNRVAMLNEKDKSNNILSLKQIENAIKNGNLKAFFQPVIDVKTGQISEYEALARIIDKNGNVYTPLQFLPVLKNSSLYIEFTKSIILQSFKKIKEDKLYISINLNIDDFINDELFKQIEQIVASNKEFAGYLNIEIIEESYKDVKIEKIITRIKKLKSYGVKITLDSFEGNNLNLDYFINLKPDYIKINMSTVLRLFKDEKITDILTDIINICKTFNIKTIAEFVENEDILDILKKNGVDMAQGYHIGKPKNLL